MVCLVFFFYFLSSCLKFEQVKKDSIELWNLLFSCSVFSHNLFASHVNWSQGQVFKEGKKVLHISPLSLAINKPKPLLYYTHAHFILLIWLQQLQLGLGCEYRGTLKVTLNWFSSPQNKCNHVLVHYVICCLFFSQLRL